jgi:diaminohydroxyphosphoribosylaminopyrimidine deaminase / 5-amino-6-(5-phosphoribosylamino)uracil reductase
MAADHKPLHRALTLAAQGRFTTPPNPQVGAVVVSPDGTVLASAHHHRAGEPHAEPLALAQAGTAARGSTVCVTLEPCSHHGRTPPCADALIEAGVAKVVVLHRDPDPRVSGRGIERLRSAGIEVEVVSDSDDPESRDLVRQGIILNWKFLAATVFRRPAVTLKWAMTLDGKIATRTGDSRWVSGPETQGWSHDLRDEHDAILVGSGTVLTDDPELTRRSGRGIDEVRGPLVRVVLDRRLRVPAAARVLAGPGSALVYAAAGPEPGRRQRADELRRAGATVVELDEPTPAAVLADLHGRGVRSVVVEGGGQVHGAFLEAGLYDRVQVVVAPKIVGGGTAPGPVAGHGVAAMADALTLDAVETSSHGNDLLISGFRHGCLQALSRSVGASASES